MKEHKHIIVLNGRQYNAKTGESVSHPGKNAHAMKTPRPIPVHKPATPHETVHKPARRPAGHVKAHAPKPAKTLMRQAVKKPSPSLKRHLRVQARLDSQIKQPVIVVPHRTHQAPRRAAKSRKVHLIHHFSPSLFTTVTTVVTTEPAPRPSLISDRPIANHDVTPRPTMRPAFAPRKPRTTAELLEYAIRYADSPQAHQEPGQRKHARRKFVRRRAHAVAH
ncbi:MAG TPA: hypothetical protein VD706_00105 [Candidatus Saccharimonadales bacterium]|nr:hypothetical protein [Candidatus Saccharimonadales bacterium]